MGRTSLLHRFPAALSGVLALTMSTGGALAWAETPVGGSVHLDASTSTSTPSPAPLPTSLPDGSSAESAVLYGSSCSSASFCVAVGYVVSARGGNFPLVETYTGGTWTPSVTPLPQGYGPTTDGTLYSVSCPTDGTCGAVGDYLDPGGSQQALLETMSGGRWTATEGARPTAFDGGLINLRSVSCGDSTTCVAIGDFAYGTSYLGLVYILTSGTWQLQPAPPLPPDYRTGLVLSSVSCPDTRDCVAVGSYDNAPAPGFYSSQSLILTLASGSWSVQQAPLPTNADAAANAVGLQVLQAVDCPAPGTCVAGGGYVDTTGTGDALLVSLQGGTWSASEAPVPSGQVNQWAIINGISCPAVGTCVANGSELDTAGVQSGIVLTQSSSGWSAATAPVPVTPFMRTVTHAAPAKAAHPPRAPQAAPASYDLVGVSCTTAKFCVGVDSVGDAFVFNGTTWVADSGIAPNGLAGVSCYNTAFCEAIGSSSAFRYNGTSWSSTPLNDSGKSVLADSCPTSVFCEAVDNAGNALKWNGTSWSNPKSIDGTNVLQAVSCPSATSCEAVDKAGNALKYYSGTWSKRALTGAPDLLSVGCSNVSFCEAGDSAGNAWKYNGSKWTSKALGNALPINGMSCTSSSFCEAVDNGGHAVVYNGTSWTSNFIDPGVSLTSVSCPSRSFCGAVDASGDAMMYDSSGWLTTNIDGTVTLTAISCTTSPFCVAVDGSGYELTYTGDVWSWSSSQITTAYPNAISCPGASFCEAGDNAGNAIKWNGTTWSSTNIAGSNSVLSISCPSSSFCEAGDNAGNAWAYTGSWSTTPSSISSASIQGMSCTSSSFCEAVDNAGNAIKWNGTKWSSTNIDGTKALLSVSCPTSSFCETVDNSGNAIKWNGTTWSSPTSIDSSNHLSSVSCSGSSFCKAVDILGNVFTYSGSWSASSGNPIDSNGFTSVSCPSKSFCGATDFFGNVLTLNGAGNWSSPTPV